MSASRRAMFVFFLVVTACAGGDDTTGSPPTTILPVPIVTAPDASAPPETTSPPASTTTNPTVEPAPTTEVSEVEPGTVDSELALLVPAPEGLALWQRDRVDWLVTDRAVAAAMPDLAGGVLFQYVDPAEPEWVWDEGVHQWVTAWPSGEPEPIRRQRTPGGPTEIAVPADGSRLWLLDVGMVDGEPAVAFGRLVGGDEPIAVGFDYCAEVDRCGDFSWRVELVVRSIDGGEERVVHRALWQPGITESTAYTARLGQGLVALSVHPYPGDPEGWGAVELFDPDGERIETGYRATPWCVGCDVVADLAPSSPAFAYVERYRDPADGRLTARAEAVLVDTTKWTERWRVDVSGGQTVDTDGARVVIAADSTCESGQGPVLGPGDDGAWVERLQRQLNRFIDAGLVVDGRYGPATERAVIAWQELRGVPPTGVMEPYTWAGLLPDRSCTTDLVVVEAGNASSTRLDIGWGLWDPAAGRGAPTRGFALWIGAAPEVAGDLRPGASSMPAEREGLAILDPEHLGPFTFDANADEVQAWLVEQLGEPDVAVVEPGRIGWPLMSCVERRFSYWADAGFTVGYTDLNSYDATGTVADCDDAPHLAGWYVATEGSPWFAPGHGEAPTIPLELRLTTAEGIGLGSTARELRAADPSVTFGEWDIDEYAPATFQTSSGLRGRVAWDPIAEVQRALNEHGAALAVDGAFGPLTAAALVEFQSSNGIDETRLGPGTLDMLGVDVSDDAPIVYLSAGRWDWNF